MYILKIPAKPHGGGRAESKLGNDLVFGLEYFAQLDGVESFCSVAWDALLLYIFVQRELLKTIEWKGAKEIPTGH